MTDAAQRLAEAERDAVAARERLSSTVTTLQTRLDPRTLARSTVNDIANRGVAAANDVRRNPAVVAGVAILAGLFFARRPIAKAVRRSIKTLPGKRPRRQKE